MTFKTQTGLVSSSSRAFKIRSMPQINLPVYARWAILRRFHFQLTACIQVLWLEEQVSPGFKHWN